ncbi:MAG: flagellar biosynthesis anti-sigma factor FlgM [Planctomycetes bacterium]|nr:flagellar biosynthesis anti-sigma factor FlgM [Planctomycetota bacterium]
MNDIPPIQSAGQLATSAPQRVSPAKPVVFSEPGGDELDISETGRLLSSLGPDSGIRAEKVAEIRRAIAEGTYETDERLEVTVDRLLNVLRSTNVPA